MIRYLAAPGHERGPLESVLAPSLRTSETGSVLSSPTTCAAGAFYTEDADGTVVAAANPAEVIEASGRTWVLDVDWLRAWLGGTADPSRTPYDGLRRLLPGQSLTVDSRGRTSISSSVGPDSWPEPDLEGADAVAAFRDAFGAAVSRIAAECSVLTTELSGGLDSTFMVATMAGHVGPGRKIHSFVAVPAREAELPETDWVVDDSPAARDLAARYVGTVDLQSITAPTDRSPLQVAAEVGERCWWPLYGVSNLPWIDAIRRQAQHLISPVVWQGTNGNAAFSYAHAYAVRTWRTRLRQAMRRRGAPVVQSDLTEPFRSSQQADRRGFLTWLAGHGSAFSGFDRPGVLAVPAVDPFRAPEVLEVAARIKPSAWRRPGVSRGFAREAGAGIVPDSIRLRKTRGAQGLDVWRAMSGHRQDYQDALELVPDTPVIADLIDSAAIRTAMQGWAWGTPHPPPQLEVGLVNRILGFAAFIRMTSDRLRVGRTTLGP